jgi:hypothetical protein
VADQDNSSSTENLRFPTWQREYHGALVEVDPRPLQQRVLKAEEAIFTRLLELVDTPNADAERQAIQNALAGLRVLKRDKLGFPDWEKK